MIWSVAGPAAWEKWDWTFKTLVFSAFIPLVIRSHVQIEAFAQTYLMSLAANFIPFGIKVMISGGGYGVNLGLIKGNSGLAEGGYLSTACLMAIPLALHFARHSVLMPKSRFTTLAYWGIAALALATALGTYQRSALVGLACLALFMILRSKNKFVLLTVAGIVGAVLVYAMSDRWTSRIQTIGEYQTESSALVRVLVWKWTWNWVQSNPLGGGFNSYMINQISLPPDAYNPGGSVQFGRAFHSSYFEVLGEQGYPGMLLFLGIVFATMWNLFRLSRKTAKIPELAWCSTFAIAIQTGLVAFLSAGAFVGIAFQPPFWYFVSMGVCLTAYVRRVEAGANAPTTGWRATAQRNLTVAVAVPGTEGLVKGGWRPAAAAPTVEATANASIAAAARNRWAAQQRGPAGRAPR